MSSTMIPVLRYQNAPKAIEWLTGAFGFTAKTVVKGEGDEVKHAQLTYGGGMLMLGTVRPDDPPRAPGERQTGFYVLVEDADAHAAQARRAGATITTEPYDEDYGGRAYACLDLEGYAWSFGSYDPWAE
jgi:uncharacterized glyoxalase superfamily protein PhnB